MTEIDYEALEARLTDPATPLRASGILTGAAAARDGQEFLLRAYGSHEAIEAELRRGRRRVGDRSGASPTIRGRVTDADYAAFTALQQATGRSQAELLREAVHDLLAKHDRAS